MRLGTQTGSLVNHLMSGAKGGPVPVVGMPATVLHWTDRSPATVSRVSPSGKTVWVRGDHATRVDDNGMSECQTYEYTPNPTAHECAFRLGKRGWKQVGGSAGLHLGHREKYHDFSF